MASDTRARASDADRDQAAAALREHLAAGRLTTEEFDERLDKADRGPRCLATIRAAGCPAHRGLAPRP